MTPWLLARRTLRSQWRLGVLTSLCVAISASVIVGALTVGDSVRGSLWRRLVVPLGSVTYALAPPSPLSAERAREGVSAALRLQGSASNQGEATVGGVAAWGVDDRFHDLVPDGPATPANGEAWITPALARDLGLEKGAPLFLRLPKLTAAPPQAVFGRRTPVDTTIEVVATVAGVLPESGMARFSLDPSFRPLRSAFLRRSWLARQLGREDAANVLLGDSFDLATGLSLGDVGLRLVRAARAGGWVLQSDNLVLRADQVEAAQKAAGDLGVRSARVSIALATTVEGNARTDAYAMAAWVEGVSPALNTWGAEDLGAKPAQTVRADLLTAKPDGGFGMTRVEAVLGPTLPMTGIGAEPALVPQVEGVTDAGRVDQWDPPFPIDRGRITQRDEAYWDQNRAAPRLFLSQEQLVQAWGGGDFIIGIGKGGPSEGIGRPVPPVSPSPRLRGEGTGVRGSGDLQSASVPTSTGDFVTGVWIRGGARETLETGIGARLLGPKSEWTVPVRENAVKAAQGSTNMAMLVLALGVFVLAGALGLAATAFTLAVRQQDRAHAILSATGVPRRAIVASAALQGGVLAVLGGVLGIPGGIAFAAAALGAMKALMPPDLGFEAMGLEVSAASVLGGAALAVAIALAALGVTLRSVGRGAVVPVLRGGESPSPRGLGKRPAVLWMVLAVACVGSAFTQGGPARGLLLGAGIFCFGVGVLAFALAGPPQPTRRLDRNTFLFRQIRDTAPSVLLGVVLSGLATFVLAAVAGHLKAAGSDDHRLLVSTSVPVKIDFGTEEGRRRLGFREEELAASRGMKVASFLKSPGDDVSCLNPAKPVRPRFLGVPFATAMLRPFDAQPRDAWERLLATVPPGEPVPALADADTVAWTFESGVGKTIPWHGDREVRFVGVLEGSALAREILVSATEFRTEYPTIASPSFFVVAPEPGQERVVAGALERTLAPLGPEIRTVREEIAALRGVQAAYMAIFLALGSFGLALGVVGAAFVALREAAARQARYALLRAVGLGRGEVAFLAVAPGIVAAMLGVVLGSAACAIGSPRDFALGPVAVVVGCLILVLALVNLAIGRRWRGDNLVEALRSE